MKNKELKEILSECMREAGSIEELAERLTSAGVVYAPADNAEFEIRNAELRVAGKIFAEIDKALNNSVKTELFKGTWFDYSKFITEVDKLKKKYTEAKGATNDL
jgi:crotonobetainyl-CoA:carnitine CoA-transferase CaiB-like acyl-CoA transferase